MADATRNFNNSNFKSNLNKSLYLGVFEIGGQESEIKIYAFSKCKIAEAICRPEILESNSVNIFF